jgi:hypothetical protein
MTNTNHLPQEGRETRRALGACRKIAIANTGSLVGVWLLLLLLLLLLLGSTCLLGLGWAGRHVTFTGQLQFRPSRRMQQNT